VQLPRVVETNSIGRPLTNVTMDRIQPGNVTRAEIQGFYITGQPVTGTFYIASPTVTNTTPGVTFSTWTATNVAAAISSLGITGHTVTEDVRPTTGVKYPIRSFHVTYGVGTRILPTTAILGVAGGPFVYNNDFFLRDNELAQLPVAAYTPPSGIADTVSGLIIRPRAQGTWTRGV
jgi:hypothetical protein